MHDRAVMLAHHPVSGRDWWESWNPEPVTIMLLVVSAVLYGVGVARLRRRARARTIAFYTALAVVAAALLSPLHGLAERLLAAHMVQHLLLILVAAPLLVYGAGAVAVIVGLPARVRRGVQKVRSRVAPARWLVLNPVLVGGLHALAMWSWHLPVPYEAGLENSLLHALQHASFLGTALLLWTLVIGVGRRRRAALGVAILLMFATMLQSGALGAVLTFATRPLYGVHVAGAADALFDQQLAGLIMWVPAGVIYLVAMAMLFGAWLKETERRSPAVAPDAPSR
jgi:putative membrane protein